MAAKKTNLLRACKDFDPNKHIQKGENEFGQQTLYLPAAARMQWFNHFIVENDKMWGIKAERITKEEDEKVVYHCEVIDFSTGTAFVIASGDGSTVKTVPYAHEKAETRAKARCLATLGFTVDLETTDELFDEGDMPVDVPVASTKGEPKQKAKKKTKEVVEAVAPENPYADVQATLDSLVKNNPQDNDDEALLNDVLQKFYPYGQLKGDRVGDILKDDKDRKVLIDYVKENSEKDFGDVDIDGIKANDFFAILNKYLIENENGEILDKLLQNFQ